MTRDRHLVNDEWPLVGRAEEIALMWRVFGSETSGVVVAGLAGVGKTRLVREAVEEARRREFATAWATATDSASSIPFGALAQLLPALGGASPVELLRRARDAVVARADGRPLAVVVDDAHLLDRSSAALIHQLVSANDAFVLATVRAGERPPDAIAALWKDELCAYIELQALSGGEIEQLLSLVLVGGVDGQTSLALWNATRGNVLYLRELIRHGLEHELLVRESSGQWRWHGRLTTGDRLVQLIQMRLGELNAQEHAHLELVSMGEPLEARLAPGLFDPDVVEGLTRREILRIADEDGRSYVRVAHPLFGEVARTVCSPLRRTTIYRSLADALERAGARRADDLLRLATWRLAAGDRSGADTLVTASTRAAALFDFELAERLASAAVAAGGGWDARRALVEPLRGTGRFEEAEALLAALTTDAATDEQRVDAACQRAANLFWGMGRSEAAGEALRSSAHLVASQTARDELAAEQARLASFSDRPLEALDAVSEILGRESLSESLGIRVALAAAPALATTGQTSAAVALADRWGVVAENTGHSVAREGLEVAAALALGASGAVREAEARVHAGYQRALAGGSHLLIVHWSAVCGCAALAGGRVRSALRWLEESVVLLREFDPTGNLTWTLAVLAQAAAQAGDMQRAHEALADAEAARSKARTLFEHDLFLARAWVAAAGGRLSEARKRAIEAADHAESRGQLAFALLSLHDLVRLGDADHAAERLARVAPRVDGALADICSHHASAVVHRDAPQLDQAASDFEACGALLRGAEAASDAAVAYRLSGRDSSARMSAARSRMLAERCEQPRTPALARVSGEEELTPREHEIARLAAGGLPNREIAAHLVLSVRTVENHLQRAYQKLGVRTRAQLKQLYRSSGHE